MSKNPIKRFINFVLFTGHSKAEYDSVYESMIRYNHFMLKVLSCIACGIFIFCLVISNFVPVMHHRFNAYGIGLAISAVILILSFITPTGHKFIKVLTICFYCNVLFVGMLIALVFAPTQYTVTLVAILVIVPLVFEDVPFKVLIVMIITDIIYVVIAHEVQLPSIVKTNCTNVLIFSFSGIVLGTFSTKAKVERYLYAKELQTQTVTDSLTGCYNRREFDIDNASTPFPIMNNLVLIAIDINGLKSVNDTKGHKAGDELISDTAKIIMETFGPIGKCYRIGGDEFSVRAYAHQEKIISLLFEFESKLAAHKGHYVDKITAAAGYVCAADYPEDTIEKLTKKADTRMYAAKHDYYTSNAALDRRNRS